MSLPKIDITNTNVIAVTRTGIAYVWVYLLGLALDIEFVANTPWIGDLLADVGTYINGEFVIVAGTALYAAIFTASKRWSWIGWFLIFKNKTPSY